MSDNGILDNFTQSILIVVFFTKISEFNTSQARKRSITLLIRLIKSTVVNRACTSLREGSLINRTVLTFTSFYYSHFSSIDYKIGNFTFIIFQAIGL